MLDINEYNKLLYRQLDKEVKRKEMMTDYGRYLQHSKNTGSESNIELQAATWLANYKGITTSDRFLRTPQGMKEICEGLIPQASKLLRKANKKGAPEETKAELRNARKFLEDCLAECNAALSHSDEDEHLEHGGKWAHHDYIDIKNGRYIYAKDKKSNKKALQKLENLKKIEANNTKYVIDKAHEATQAGANYRLSKQFDPEEKNVSTQEQKKKAEATDKVYRDSFKVASMASMNARDAIKKEAKESAEAKAKRQQIDAETDARKKAANEAKGQAEAEAKAKWQEQKAKEEAAKKQYEKGFQDSVSERSNNEIKAAKTRINAATDPNDEWLVKQANNKYDEELRNSAQQKIDELKKKSIPINSREEAEKKSTKATQESTKKYVEDRDNILKAALKYHDNLLKNGQSLQNWSDEYAWRLDEAYKKFTGSYSGNKHELFSRALDEYEKKNSTVKHSAMTATAMSKEEYEELLKKVESLT